MSETPEYHKAPHTLDPSQEIDEDAPLSAGNEEDQAEQVKAAAEGHKQAVEDTPDEEVGPGDPTLPKDEDGVPQEQADDGSDVPDGTVQEVLDWVGDDPERAQRALDVERSGQNRSSLVAELEKRL